MKKRPLLFAALLLTALPLPVHAEEETAPSAEPTEPPLFSYGLDAEGHAELTDFLPSGEFTGAVNIPSEIDGHIVDYIGANCFQDAAGVTSVTIPATVTDMGENVFLGCTALDTVQVAADNPYYTVTDGVLYADGGKLLCLYPAAGAAVQFTVPQGVEEIAAGAFGYAQRLQEVVIPEGVCCVDSYAFAFSGIERVEIAGSVSELEEFAFANCLLLQEAVLQPGIQKIGNAAFYNCTALGQITLPDSLAAVGAYAFCGTGLTHITVPASVETISDCAFGYTGNPASGSTAVPDFVIYGEPSSAAQTYATAHHFPFVSAEEAPSETMPTETVPAETPARRTSHRFSDPGGKPADWTHILGAGLFRNPKVLWMLGIGGGTALILSAVLLIFYLKKPKRKTVPTETAQAQIEEVPENPDAAQETPTEEAASQELH